MEAYSIDANVLAQMIAAHTSGIADAIAEQEDLDLATSLIKQIDERFN